MSKRQERFCGSNFGAFFAGLDYEWDVMGAINRDERLHTRGAATQKPGQPLNGVLAKAKPSSMYFAFCTLSIRGSWERD